MNNSLRRKNRRIRDIGFCFAGGSGVVGFIMTVIFIAEWKISDDAKVFLFTLFVSGVAIASILGGIYDYNKGRYKL